MPTRLAPNPQGALPLHLTLSLLPWLASNAALQMCGSGLSSLKAARPPFLQNPSKLEEGWQRLLGDPLLARAVESEARRRAAEFLEGLQHYRHMPFIRDVEEPPAAFSCGAAKLLDYGSPDGAAPVVLLIPSLINRYYILDLTQKLSFARHLRAKGLHVFVVDWGTPSDKERHYNCSQYITEILVPMAEWIRAHTKGDIIPGGYCMGGLMALALGQIRPELISGLAFFAVPWDFSARDFLRFSLNENEIVALAGYIDAGELFPAETIHMLFHSTNPYVFQQKLREFSRMDARLQSTQEFLAIEHWVNDGVPMTRAVARDCFIDWTQRNTTAKKQWRVGGQIIDPVRQQLPCFVAAPQEDKIVPSGCALPLARLLSNHTLVTPQSGHVGMMAGRNRKAALWEPFVNWIYDQFT